MSELVRAMDWSRSPLGPVDTWTKDLQSVLESESEPARTLLWAMMRAYERELERAEALASLFDQAPVPILVLEGEDLRVTLQNAYACRLFGPRRLSRPLVEAFPELEGQPLVREYERVLCTGEASAAAAQRILLRDANGELRERYFDSVIHPLRDASGRVIGVASTQLDVTSQVLAQRKLEEATRTKDEFLAMLGHELRNPLSPILTALQLMRLRGSESREQGIIERQVSHLTRLVDDLLDVSRITGGKIELRKRATEIADVAARAIEMVSPLLEQRRHRLDVRVPRQGLCALVDPDRMAQVVSNLLANAAKYSDPGSRITLTANREGSTLLITVKDEGIGIDPEMLDRVFDLFVQQPQTLDRSKGGLGLGLTIVRSLVHLSGGTVRASSDGVGKGSEFVVELPAIDAVLPPQSPYPIAPLSRARPSDRVLVVDDNDDAAATLAEALEELGYQVRVAHDGPTAIVAVETFHPGIALVDIGLPVMDGYELAQRLRQATQNLHLVAVTGYGQEADRLRSAAAGFERHLVKPIDVHKLDRVMRELRA